MDKCQGWCLELRLWVLGHNSVWAHPQNFPIFFIFLILLIVITLLFCYIYLKVFSFNLCWLRFFEKAKRIWCTRDSLWRVNGRQELTGEPSGLTAAKEQGKGGITGAVSDCTADSRNIWQSPWVGPQVSHWSEEPHVPQEWVTLLSSSSSVTGLGAAQASVSLTQMWW